MSARVHEDRANLPARHEALCLAMGVAGMGVWRWEPSAERLYLSSEAGALLGVTGDSLTGDGLLGLVHPEDRDGIAHMLRAVQAGAETSESDFRTLQAGGAGRWLRICGRRGVGPGGGEELHGVLFDISRGKAADAATSRLAAILDVSDDAIIATTLDGIITDWNPGAEGLFGYLAGEMIGGSLAILLPPDHQQEAASFQERLRRGERIAHAETRRRRKDGAIIDVSLTMAPYGDGSGRLCGASIVVRDRTEARRSETELAEREAHLHAVLETVLDGMIVIDPQGVIRSFSMTAARLFGYEPQDVLGRNVSMLMPAPYRDEHDGYMTHYMTTGQRRVIGIGRLVVGRRKDGSTFPMELSVGEVRSGAHRFFTGFVRDLTERQQTQKRLQELQAELFHMSRFTALGEMASTLAHELNQPLSAVANYLNGGRRLLDGGQNESLPMVRDAMGRAMEQALRAGDIIRRLREFVSRGESARQLENLPRLIEEASGLALVGVKETGVHVSYALDPRAEYVFADKIQIQQVLLNLIRNALEAMQDCANRQLTLSTRQIDAQTAQISVADTGTGIADDIRAQLFRPFVTTKAHGMGVGLSISRTIVEAHNGRMWAEANPAGGTIFHLTLRTQEEDPDSAH